MGWVVRVPPMFRRQLPRFYELKDLITDPSDPNAYFPAFENLLRDAICLECFRCWERQLHGLDDGAWRFLKGEVTPYLVCKSPGGRGWQQLFDILGQARAYNHLRESLGCSKIHFIPRSTRSAEETPDLEGTHGSGRVLCEVKTINVSDDEVLARRMQYVVRPVHSQLEKGFLRKLDFDIAKAKNQLDTYDATGSAQHLVYINICFDDWAGHYQEDYRQQIDQHLSQHPPGVEVVFGAGSCS
jgi:hypothetical protein